jgi:hypothetical protein
MTFLAPYFTHDVFVSYSHGDPLGTNESPLKRWTIALVHELIAEIRAIDTEFDGLDVWLDEHLDPTAHLTDELRHKVGSSGILMIMMSPRYLSSTMENLGFIVDFARRSSAGPRARLKCCRAAIAACRPLHQPKAMGEDMIATAANARAGRQASNFESQSQLKLESGSR